MIHTQEQTNILGVSRKPSQSLIIGALAGTGKTTTLIEVLKQLPESSTLVLAFNKRIEQEFVKRQPPLPRHRIVHIKTLNAAGYWITRHHFPRVTMDRDVTEQRIRDAAGAGARFTVLGAATRLLRIVKDLQHNRELNLDVAFALGHDFDCFNKLGSVHEVQQVVEVVARAYRASLDVGATIDFPDQGWLPLVLGLEPPSRYKAILLDEAQDVNENQIEMVERLLAPGGRVIAAGDLNQQIYSWRGASGTTVWQRIKDKHKAVELPLTCTWRCDAAIVAEANQLVPALRSRPNVAAGLVRNTSELDFYDQVVAEAFDGVGDGSVFVLSRTNAELLRVALEMWRRRISFNIAQSADVLNPIKAILRKLNSPGNDRKPAPRKPALDDDVVENSLSQFYRKRQAAEEIVDITRVLVMGSAETITPVMEQFKQTVGAWYMTEMMKAQAAGSQSQVERIEDYHKTILYCTNYVKDPRDIEPLLEQIYLTDEHVQLTLSTVHKAKGLEADYVYLLRETFQRHQKRVNRDGAAIPVPQEELNVEYVGITRARKVLTWVSLVRPEK